MFQHTAARRRLDCAHGSQSPLILFQHTAARRRLPIQAKSFPNHQGFNTQPPEGGCKPLPLPIPQQKVSTHSRPKAADTYLTVRNKETGVSTHSRPKAAAMTTFLFNICQSFNTQPPEGGWRLAELAQISEYRFNTQPPEGG